MVDGLDEMAAEAQDIADVLPAWPGRFVRVVVSSRPHPDPREFVIREHPLRSAEELALAPFDQSIAAEVLVTFEFDRSRATELAPRVVALTGGEPLFTRLVGRSWPPAVRQRSTGSNATRLMMRRTTSATNSVVSPREQPAR